MDLPRRPLHTGPSRGGGGPFLSSWSGVGTSSDWLVSSGCRRRYLKPRGGDLDPNRETPVRSTTPRDPGLCTWEGCPHPEAPGDPSTGSVGERFRNRITLGTRRHGPPHPPLPDSMWETTVTGNVKRVGPEYTPRDGSGPTPHVSPTRRPVPRPRRIGSRPTLSSVDPRSVLSPVPVVTL